MKKGLRQPRSTQHRPYQRRDQRDKADQNKDKKNLWLQRIASSSSASLLPTPQAG
jgi:hypothetical protein